MKSFDGLEKNICHILTIDGVGFELYPFRI